MRTAKHRDAEDDEADAQLLDVTVGELAHLGHDLMDFHEEEAEAVDGDAERHHGNRCPDPGEECPFVGEMIADVSVDGDVLHGIPPDKKRARPRRIAPRSLPSSDGLVVLRDLEAADLVAMNLVRTVGQAQRALMGVHAGQLEDLADAAGAMELQAAVHHLGVMFGTATLIIAICWRASLLPYLSIAHAALRTSRRAMSISMRISATWALVTPISEMRWPKATRLLARLIAISSARSATPMARMQ